MAMIQNVFLSAFAFIRRVPFNGRSHSKWARETKLKFLINGQLAVWLTKASSFDSSSGFFFSPVVLRSLLPLRSVCCALICSYNYAYKERGGAIKLLNEMFATILHTALILGNECTNRVVWVCVCLFFPGSIFCLRSHPQLPKFHRTGKRFNISDEKCIALIGRKKWGGCVVFFHFCCCDFHFVCVYVWLLQLRNCTSQPIPWMSWNMSSFALQAVPLLVLTGSDAREDGGEEIKAL